MILALVLALAAAAGMVSLARFQGWLALGAGLALCGAALVGVIHTQRVR